MSVMNCCENHHLNNSDDEIAEAKRVLAGVDKKGHRAAMAKMSHWLKQNSKENAEAIESRGSERAAFLEKILVQEMRDKSAKKVQINEKSTRVSRRKNAEIHEWTAEKMDAELGAKKGKFLRESGKIASQPCSVTGSTDPDVIEWLVPVNWRTTVNFDDDLAKIEISNGAQ